MFLLTALVDSAGCALALWLGLYLLGRGFSSRITLRAVLVLLASSVFFLIAYTGLYVLLPGAARLQAVLITFGLALWCDLSARLFLPAAPRKLRWLPLAGYACGLLTAALLAVPGLPFISIVYGLFILGAGLVILYHVLTGVGLRAGLHRRYFLGTTLLVFNLVGFGLLAQLFAPPIPSVLQDVLVFASVILLGIAVAQQQALLERRTSLRDFVVSALAVFVPAALYALIAWQWSRTPLLALLVGLLAVLTHGSYDVVRGFFERLRQEGQDEFRRQLRRLEKHAEADTPLQQRLQQGIRLLCQILDASEGLVAVRGADGAFVVSACYHSLPVGTLLPAIQDNADDIYRPAAGLADRLDWLAPAFAGGQPLALVGLGPARARLHYSEDDLDLLAEAADRVGTIVQLDKLQGQAPATDELITTLVTNPDPEFVGMVEESLRNLSDISTLGQYPLSQSLAIPGESHIERGKALRERLIRAVEALRPGKLRPRETLPREWYEYVVLHDAYIEGAPNRDIMARLYISEGTFNRTRRKALRGVARSLLEKREQALS